MKHRAVYRSVITLLVVTAVLAGCSSGDSPSSDSAEEGADPIRIGAVLSLTGSYAGLGGPERNAIELEVARINDEGGINGRDIEVVIEDDGTDAAAAQAAVTKLVDQEGVVAILGATGTGQTMGMRVDVERAGIPQVSMAGGSVITEDFNEWVFQTPWPNRIVVPFTLEYLQENGIERIALLSDSGGYGADGVAVTKSMVADYGIEIVAEETYNAGDADMSAQLTKINATDAQTIWLWGAGSEAATVLQNQVDLTGESLEDGDGVPVIVGAPGNARIELIDGAGAAANGFEFSAGRILLPESYGEDTEAYEVATDFISRYEAQYGTRPDIFAGHAYDALHIVVEALRRLPEGDVDAAALRDEIEATNGFVGIGGTFSFSEDDHNGLTGDDLVMYRIEDGAWTLAEEGR